MSQVDALSGLCNRRCFFQKLEEEVARSRRTDLPLSILMVDIDRFKAINDRYGHPVGDRVIQRLATVMKGSSRRIDTVARVGGEEFALLLPGTDLVAAVEAGERIRSAVACSELVTDRGERIAYTISVGAARWHTREKPSQCYNRADRALYLAKKGGRNRVVSLQA